MPEHQASQPNSTDEYLQRSMFRCDPRASLTKNQNYYNLYNDSEE